jgi:hypothetical protein
MDPEKSYILSQVLGKNYQDNSNEEPTLHNLTYLNKLWHEGDKDRYIQQECTRSVTRIEFLRWFEKSNPQRISVFVYVPQAKTRLDVTIGKLLLKEYTFNIYNVFKYGNLGGIIRNIDSPSDVPILSDRPSDRTNYTKQESVNMFHYALLTVDKNWYGGPENIITFDVVTLYGILSARGNCTQIIKNYARNLVLKMFNNFVDKFKTESVQFLRVYLFGNAFALNIDDIDYLVDNKVNMDNDQNLAKATQLIEDIRNKISTTRPPT